MLPEQMSQQHTEWFEQWVTDPEDIIRIPGPEPSVKEIYNQCAVLAEDDRNVILDEFSEYGNYLVHYECTGKAASHIYEHVAEETRDLKLAGFVAATDCVGTLGAGDHLKDAHGSMTIAVESIECPTLLRNGYCSDNTHALGEKYVPLIHNVMNTDVVVGISSQSSTAVHLLFNTPAGRSYLASRRDIAPALLEKLPSLGLSSIANVLAAIRFAHHFNLGADSLVVTVATDHASASLSQIPALIDERFRGDFDEVRAGEVYGEHLAGLGRSQLRELTYEERVRVFNLGYHAWVEQFGVSDEEFELRRSQNFWKALRTHLPDWDAAIERINARVDSRW